MPLLHTCHQQGGMLKTKVEIELAEPMTYAIIPHIPPTMERVGNQGWDRTWQAKFKYCSMAFIFHIERMTLGKLLTLLLKLPTYFLFCSLIISLIFLYFGLLCKPYFLYEFPRCKGAVFDFPNARTRVLTSVKCAPCLTPWRAMWLYVHIVIVT